MFANLCNYDTRIDTTKLEEQKYTLSGCLFTLSIMNGDLSFLAAIFPKERAYRRDLESKPNQTFSWIAALPRGATLADLYWPAVNNAGLRVDSMQLKPDGLHLSGFLWIVDTEIDLAAAYEYPIMRRPYHHRGSQDPPGSITDHYGSLLLHLNQNGYHSLCETIWKFITQRYETKPGDDSFGPKVPLSWAVVYRESITPRIDRFLIWKKLPSSTRDIFGRMVNGKSGPRVELVAPARKTFNSDQLRRIEQKDWLLQTIVERGKLFCGRMVSDSMYGNLRTRQDFKKACDVVFDVRSKTTILTPAYDDPSEWFRVDDIKYRRMSWVVKKRKGDPQKFTTSGMVRGMWDQEGRKAENFVLV